MLTRLPPLSSRQLEDQVAALETKNQNQATENENLRELLGRLQNENLMLKQSAFTFNLSANTPRTNTANVTSRPTPSSSSPSVSLNPANKAGSTPSSTAMAPTPTDSPDTNHQLGLTTAPGYTPLLSFNNGSTTSLTNIGGDSGLISMMSTDNSPPLNFLPSPTTATGPSPYTTIASNPLFTSFTDFSAWDQFFANSNMDMTLAGITQPGGPSPPIPGGSDNTATTNAQAGPSKIAGDMENLFQATGNFAEMMPFSGFSPLGNGASLSAANSPVEHRSTPSAAVNTNSAFTLESRESHFDRPLGLKPRTSSPCGGADPDEAALPGSSHHNPNHPKLSDMGMASHPPGHNTDQCPKSKEDVERIIQSQPITTLGSVPGMNPPYTPEKQVRLNQVWATLKSHPRFEVGRSLSAGYDAFAQCATLHRSAIWMSSVVSYPRKSNAMVLCLSLIQARYVISTIPFPSGPMPINNGSPNNVFTIFNPYHFLSYPTHHVFSHPVNSTVLNLLSSSALPPIPY